MREFLRPKSPAAAKRAGETILKAIQVLARQPQIGCPAEEMPPEYHEWPIGYGDSGYLVLYRYDGETGVILAIRHQREVGYLP